MEKNLDAISIRFYWPGLEEDIRKWINDDKVERTVDSQSLTTGLQHLPKVHNVVLENVEKVREKVRKRKTRQGQEDRFEVGDKVLGKNI
ncbi:unnamed protein product [Leuciscus chuanchicus]